MAQLKAKGMSLIFVTHFLDQVYRITDRITVLRNGQFIATRDTATLPQIELIKLMLGRELLDGEVLKLHEPIDAIRAGVMLCPEDRKSEGIIPVHSVRDNINISARRHNLTAGCLIKNQWETRNADSHIRSLNIKTPHAEQLIMNLSGGNKQKAILGRWLLEEMKVIT